MNMSIYELMMLLKNITVDGLKNSCIAGNVNCPFYIHTHVIRN